MTSVSDAVVYSAISGYVYSKHANDLPLNLGEFGVKDKNYTSTKFLNSPEG